MNVKDLKIYTNKKKKYKIVKVISGILTVQMLLSALTGCQVNNKKYHYEDRGSNSNYHNYYDNYNEYVEPNYSNTESGKHSETRPENNVSVPDLTLDLDDYSLEIVNSKVRLNPNSLNTFINYIKNINVPYLYSDLYGTGAILSKYELLGTYKSSSKNLFVNNRITGDELYTIVKQNNIDFGVVPNATMSDSDLREVCSIMASVLNDYIRQYPNTDLNHLSEKISDLKILKFDDFSNGYFDSTNGKMGFNVSYLKSKSNDTFKKTVEHETYHFIQGNSLGERDCLNFENRMGFSYKFNDIAVNSLAWNWYYEGAAEYLVCNRNNTRDSEVYESTIKSMDTIKVATILSQNNHVNDFENISLSSNLDDLFNYFGCETLNEKIEVLNLMYSYNIIFNMGFSSSDFYSQYKSIYGQKANKIQIEKELNNSIAQSLTKYFYRDLAILVTNKDVSVEEIFKLISVFENELSREIWYNSNQETLNEFFEMYNDVQTNFFNIIASSLNISVEDVQQAYNSYNKKIDVNLNDTTIINEDKTNFYNYILETRENDKMNSINYVSQKYNSNKQR